MVVCLVPSLLQFTFFNLLDFPSHVSLVLFLSPSICFWPGQSRNTTVGIPGRASILIRYERFKTKIDGVLCIFLRFNEFMNNENMKFTQHCFFVKSYNRHKSATTLFCFKLCQLDSSFHLSTCLKRCILLEVLRSDPRFPNMGMSFIHFILELSQTIDMYPYQIMSSYVLRNMGLDKGLVVELIIYLWSKY